ncbi:MAG TPA: SBBP repeat-containing protein [Pyrinomonadaceae bacterium]|nr:SBBP repeat-containing protein [Pyrinomonadaceae bacterium]
MRTSLTKQLTGLVIATGLLIGSIATPVFPAPQASLAGVVNRAALMRKSGRPGSQSSHPQPGEGKKERAREIYGKLPLNFEINRGQTDESVKFLARGRGYNLFLTSTEAVLSLRKETRHGKTEGLMAKAGRGRNPSTRSHGPSTLSTLRMKLVGANSEAQVRGEEQLPGTINYFTGRDAEKWQRNVSSYAKVRYENVYPGVDMVYYGNQRELEYDFVLAPGANPGNIRLAFTGAQKVSVAGNGDLILQTDNGNLIQRKPVTYQEANGSRRTVAARYVIRDGQVGFEVGDYDTSRPLIIDPILSYSTYLGGAGYDAAYSVTVDADGNAYIVGTTASADYPVTQGVAQAAVGGDNALGDAFVTKLNAAGTSLVYSTYLGGSDVDYAYDIAVDADGNAYVMGSTVSSDFPVTSGAFQTTNASSNGSEDGFVTKLNATGSTLLYSTYLGGSGGDSCRAIAINSLGEAYVTGSTQSVDFPTTSGAYHTGLSEGDSDAFVTKLNATGTALSFSTLIGGNSTTAHDLALDSNGNVYFVGETYTNAVGGGSPALAYPVTSNAYQSAPAADGFEGFMSEVSADGTQLLYSSYLGGTMEDGGIGVVLDASDNVYVAGYTGSYDFPVTSGCAQPYFAGPYDVFISKFDFSSPGTVSLVYSTYLGGSNLEDPYGVAVDADGNAYVTGYTTSYDFPVTQTSSHGWLSAFVTKLDAAGSQFLDSSCFGEVYTYAYGLALDPAGNAYVAGETTSADFPTTPGSVQTTFGDGGSDSFITKLDFVTRNADLAVELSATPEVAPPGSQLTYQINVSNNGPHQATDVTLTDELPSGVSFLSATPTEGTCAEASGTVTCELGELAQDSSVYVTIVVNITAASGTTVENTVSVSNTTTDPNLLNNSATTSTEVLMHADLSAYATAEPYWVASGSNVTYTAYVTNNGPSEASSVVLAGTLPPGVTLTGIENNYGSCTSAPDAGGGTQFNCTLGDADLNSTKTITFTGSATGDAYTLLPFAATVDSATADLQSWNDSATAGSVIASAPVPTPTPGPTDEAQLAYTSYANGDMDIFRRRADGDGLVNLTNNTAYEDNFNWSPDGSRLAFLRYDFDNLVVSLCVVDADGSDLAVLTNVSGEYIDSFSWAPDGSRIVFEGRPYTPFATTSEIYVINVDGTGRYSLSGTDDFNSRPSWSPDGTRISYLHSTYSPYTYAMNYIRVVDPDGTDLVTVARDEDERDFAPEWSPDGTRLVFTRASADSTNDIYTVGADGSDLLRLTDDSFSHSLNPHWSPDGSRISFGSELTAGSVLEIINADGSGRTALSIPSEGGAYYSSGGEKWSPDGTRLAFAYVTGWFQSGTVCVINADDTDFHCLGNALELNQSPDWSPDGTRLVFTSRRNGVGSIDIINADGTGRVDLTDQDGSYGAPRWRPAP